MKSIIISSLFLGLLFIYVIIGIMMGNESREEKGVPTEDPVSEVVTKKEPANIEILVDGKVVIIDMSQWNDFKKPDEEELSSMLDEQQFNVTQKEGTEAPFKNAYWDNHEEGIYVDVVSGEPLFSSKDKYDSGTGWPSFTKPLHGEAVTEREDDKLFALRTEVRSKLADSHLGHLFNDGPADKGGMRYCMNSASLKFIPKADLEKEGYGQFLQLFE